jgi:hypothetical protein
MIIFFSVNLQAALNFLSLLQYLLLFPQSSPFLMGRQKEGRTAKKKLRDKKTFVATLSAESA